jgi:DNA repair photolyase
MSNHSTNIEGTASTPVVVFDQVDTALQILQNNFQFKSLSNWACNHSYGCPHGCAFCYVPSSATVKQEKRHELTGKIPQQWINEREAGSHWADAHWGEYARLKTWDEDEFRKSLRRAEKQQGLPVDGNRAVMFCTTTDPYFTVSIPGNPEMTSLQNDRRRGLVRRALEMILEESTLNVRILTRSPLAQQDFDLFERFGDRLVFGMSLPTLNPTLSSVYEPNAPGPAAKLRALRAAVNRGLHVYVAVAPTLPEEGEDELRALFETVAQLKPVTIFHEPINIRAENVARIEARAAELGIQINSGVFKSREAWREYAFGQLLLAERIAREIGLPEGVFHSWPDPDLASKNGFISMKRMVHLRDHGPEKFDKRTAEAEWDASYGPWIKYWHNPEERISSWPGTRMPLWPADPAQQVAA